ncbi:MAG TPA: zinc-binding dehydrogenase [Myxococcota bacterium]|jgi:(R,R)-butanediol dehydrogenase/meso-butanediol dehydrogenase/diacetyl reductase
MQVGLVTGKREITLRDMPEPEATPGKAVVEISHCGICGTDLHAWASGAPYNPAICGHEWSGSVAQSGRGVAHVKEGDRVAIGIAPACGQCADCRSGRAAYCSAAFAGMLGVGPLAAPHGGFARAIAIDAARLIAVRAGITDEAAAMLEPATVALHAVRRTPLHLGDACVVLGAGPIGLLTQQCARAAGAGAVVVVEPHPVRRERAKQLGATAVVDPRSEDVVQRVKQLLGPLGADVVFECAGIPQTIDQSASLAKRGGVVSLVGLANAPAQISPGTWLVNEIRLVASLGYLYEEFDLTMALVQDGRLALAPLHTKTVGLHELDAAFALLNDSPAEIKILVRPRP